MLVIPTDTITIPLWAMKMTTWAWSHGLHGYKDDHGCQKVCKGHYHPGRMVQSLPSKKQPVPPRQSLSSCNTPALAKASLWIYIKKIKKNHDIKDYRDIFLNCNHTMPEAQRIPNTEMNTLMEQEQWSKGTMQTPVESRRSMIALEACGHRKPIKRVL